MRFIRTIQCDWRLALLLMATLLSGMFYPTSTSAQQVTDTPEKVRLQLKWKHQFQFAGYYAAIDKGFFRSEGLDVELVEGKPNLDPVEELLAGRVDFAIDSPAVLIRRQQGQPVVVMAAIFQHSPTVIITRQDSGLITPQSLKGKRIMLTPKTDPESMAMLVEEGIPSNSMTILPHNWGLDDLIAGRVDGQTAYITNEPYLLQKAGVAAAIIKPLSYGIDFYGDCIVTTAHEVRAHPEQLEAFLRAIKQGWQYAMQHPEEIAELIHSRYSQEKSIEHLLFEARAMRELIQPELVEIGHMNPERWRHIATTLAKLGMIKADFNLQGFLYSELYGQIEFEKHQTLKVTFAILGVLVCLSALIGLALLAFNRKLAGQVRKRTAELTASEQHFRAFFEMASVGVAQADAHTGRYQRINKKYCEIVGYDYDELLKLSFTDITHPEDLEKDLEYVQKLLVGELNEFTIEKRYIRKDGNIVWVYLTVSPLWSAGGRPDYTLAVIRDITARKLSEESLSFAARVFANSIEGIVITDAQGTILQVNPAFTAITGYSPEEAIGQNPRILKSDKHPPTFYENMWHKLMEIGQWAGEIWNRRKSGEAYPEWLTISAVVDQQGKTTNYVSIFHDISELKRQQEALEHQAQHDALTGLPNRVLINDRLEMALVRMQRHGSKVALLYLDLDNFKHINDAFGHTVGDNLLIETARRLAALLRTGDTMARLGGDEFLILLGEIEHIDIVSVIAVRLIESLQQAFYHGQIEYFVTASIGITIAPEDGSDAVTLVKNADIAMYRAKSLGRNNYQFFAPELDLQAHRRVSMEAKLRRALEHNEFLLFYQPLVHITSGEIAGAEALVRWRHEGQLIPPNEFIPLAEDSGLILPLGEWVLNEAARQAKKLQDAGYDLSISINISFRQFMGQDLVALLQKALAATHLEPGRLYFEVTESMVMGDLAKAQRIMGDLRQLGIKFYLDDFGTGYSSLSYLKRLPIDGLKIDRSFIRDIAQDADSKAIAKVIVSLAEALNLAIVAEGVETAEQWRLLREMNGLNTLLIQGYIVSRPVPADRFELLLQKGRFNWNEATL
ncbi:MAG: EAL domain-containing protein [Pseudomonadota bacterium]